MYWNPHLGINDEDSFAIDTLHFFERFFAAAIQVPSEIFIIFLKV